jgi:formiminoglutamase
METLLMHKPVDMKSWTGRIDPGGQGDTRRWHQVVQPWAEQFEQGVVLLGVASDEGVRRNKGRIGAAQGPDVIRRMLASMAFHLAKPVYDAGNIYPVDGRLEDMQQEQAAFVKDLLDRGQFPLVLGGGHEIAFGNFSGLKRHCAANPERVRIGIINFDAHFDLRRDHIATSGTPFLQIAESCRDDGIKFSYFCLGISAVANTRALFNDAESLHVGYFKDDQLNSWQMHATEEALKQFIHDQDVLYLSVDLDVLPAATAPGVSAPASRGLAQPEFEHLLTFIRRVAGDKIRVVDVAECNPNYDIDDRTAKIAARLCHLLTCSLG